jgi:hypothetical protein
VEEEIQLRPRDQLLRDTFTPAERLLFATMLLSVFITSWIADPRSFWVLGSCLIIGGFCPVILKTHEHTHPFFIDVLWTRFWLLSAPVWLIVLQFTVGVFQNPLVPINIKGAEYKTIIDVNPWLPISATTSTTWITLFGMASVYIVSMNLFIVPKSRSFFERLLPWLCLNAVLIAVLGYVQKALSFDAPLLTAGTGRPDFFAFFPYDGHWAAFALLWSSVCISMALLSSRYDDGKIFIESTGPWYLTGAILLGASGFLVQAQWPAAILLITFSAMLLMVTIHFLNTAKEPNRTSLALCSAFFSIISFAGGIFRAFQVNDSAQSARSLHRAAIEMFRDSPLFGWGMDSYAQLLPFYADDTLLGARYDRAESDLLQSLAEVGILGCLPLCLVIVYLVIRYLRGQHDIHLTNHLLIGCIGFTVFACFDSPFMSPTVTLSFFIILFSALRWADLSRNRVDEVDAKPDLIVHESKRSLPFHNKQYEEQFK